MLVIVGIKKEAGSEPLINDMWAFNTNNSTWTLIQSPMTKMSNNDINDGHPSGRHSSTTVTTPDGLLWLGAWLRFCFRCLTHSFIIFIYILLLLIIFIYVYFMLSHSNV